MNWFIDWLMNWLIDRLIDWLIDWSFTEWIDWLPVDRMLDWLIRGCFFEQETETWHTSWPLVAFVHRNFYLDDEILNRHASSELPDKKKLYGIFEANAPDFQRLSVTGQDDLRVVRQVSNNGTRSSASYSSMSEISVFPARRVWRFGAVCPADPRSSGHPAKVHATSWTRVSHGGPALPGRRHWRRG